MNKKIHWFTVLNENYDESVERAAKLILKILERKGELFIVKDDGYYVYLESENYLIKYWNENKWYAWFYAGSISKKSGSEIRKIFSWDSSGRPSRKTLNLLINALGDLPSRHLRNKDLRALIEEESYYD